jgi:hypothetical protein
MGNWYSIALKRDEVLIMNAFELLFPENDSKLASCILEHITRPIEIISLNYNNSETDTTTVLFTVKDGLSFNDGMPLLAIRYKMYCEEWSTNDTYTQEDIERWISMLKNENQQTEFIENISIDEFKDNFFVKRLYENNNICTIQNEEIELSYVSFQKINPLNKDVVLVHKISFDRLEEVFFVETKLHYVFFNWKTTA